MSEIKTGKLPENSLKRSVLRQIGEKGKEVQSGAGIGRDCAILAFQEERGLTVSVQEAAVISHSSNSRKEAGEKTDGFPEPYMTLGELMQKCANNLAAGGSRPFAFLVTLLMPEGTEEGDVRALMAEAAAKAGELSAETERFRQEEQSAAQRTFPETGQVSEKVPAPGTERSITSGRKEASVKIIGGQTRITGGVAFPYGVITGFGRLQRNTDSGIADGKENGGAGRRLSTGGTRPGRGKALPGQDVVLSKWIGLQGTAVLAKRNREKLSERYPAWLAEEAAGFGRYLSVLPEAEIGIRAGAEAMHDASEGGILGALWELAEGAGTGLTIDMRKLPLRQETVEVCECCNVNPYELLSGGCLIMTAADGPGLAAALEKAGIPAAVVGKVTDSNDRILINGEEVRYMDRPQQDGIYRK